MKRNSKYLSFVFIFLIIISFRFLIVSSNNDKYKEVNDDCSDINVNLLNINDENQEESNFKLTYENKSLSYNPKILLVNNRCYISFGDIAKIINGSFNLNKNVIIISNKDNKITINPKKKIFSFKDGNGGNLRNDLKDISLRKYLSLYDFCKIFNLKTTWDHDKKTINLFKNRENIISGKQEGYGRSAFIRFEDVTAGVVYLNENSLEKLRIIGDYFYSQGIPFHIAWVPRYVNPSKNIDNDLLTKNNIENADFIYTFDYLIDKGATIGLHGYTHQNANEESIIGTEFSSKINTDEKEIKDRIEKAISTANKLNIPISFFETPHYRATEFQQSIFEEYFDIIYEPYIGKYNKIPLISLRNNKTLYIPTPLSYVKGDDGIYEMIKNIDNNDISQVASLFVHPSKEFDFIKINKEKNGYHSYSYDSNSILHKIVFELKIKGYRIINIKDYR